MEKNRLCDEFGLKYRDIKAFEASVEQLWRRVVNEIVDRLTRTQNLENRFTGIFQPKETATTDSGGLFRSFITNTKLKILKRDDFLGREKIKETNAYLDIQEKRADEQKNRYNGEYAYNSFWTFTRYFVYRFVYA